MNSILKLTPLLALTLAACGSEKEEVMQVEQPQIVAPVAPECMQGNDKVTLVRMPMSASFAYSVGASSFQIAETGAVRFRPAPDTALSSLYRDLDKAEDPSGNLERVQKDFLVRCPGQKDRMLKFFG